LCFLILFLAFAGVKQLVGAINDYRNGGSNSVYQTVSFTGEGKVKSTPDTARVDIGLVTEGADTITVQNENSKKMNAVIGFVKEQGIKDEDVKTSTYSLSPKYSYTKGKSILVGYILNQMITVTIRDLEKVGKILDGSVSAGANEISSVSLFTDKPEELKNKAREDAVNQAKEKAKSASKTAGFRLGRLIGFSENFSGEPRMYYEKMGMGGGASSSVAPSPQIEPGSQDITVNITLTYLIK
jgi:uncharacterized protein YggE